MIALIKRRPAERVADFPTITDLYEIVDTDDGKAQTQLWEDADGRVVGFAIMRPYVNAMFYEVASIKASGALENEILRWGQQQIRQANSSRDKPDTLRISCPADYLERIGVLEQNSFQAQPVRTLQMTRSLREPLPEPQLLPGFTIRHVTGEQEAEALTLLHQAAFGTQNLTVEARLAWMRTPEYDPELDLLIVAPSGSWVAYCMCSISQEQNALTGHKLGYTDPIGTHPDFRRQGLARALLLTGLRYLKERGMDSAALSTWGENSAMQKTAESVGFQVTATTIFFVKEVN